MQIIRIDETNFRAHMDKIALVFGLTEDDLSQLPLRAGASVMSSSASKWGPERVLDAALRCYHSQITTHLESKNDESSRTYYMLWFMFRHRVP